MGCEAAKATPLQTPYRDEDCVNFNRPSSRQPAITEATLATCALDNPRIHGGLIRMISTRKRATPVKIR